MNTDELWPDLYDAESQVLKIQTKLHQSATDDPNRRFSDLYNLVYDPAFWVVAWARVRGNRGARSAGVDGVKPRSIVFGAETLLAGLRAELKARTFRALPVRERMIPMSWRGRPLTSNRVMVQLITNTTTKEGLTVNAEVDEGYYPTGVKISDKELAAVPLTRDEFHRDWNCTVHPAPLK